MPAENATPRKACGRLIRQKSPHTPCRDSRWGTLRGYGLPPLQERRCRRETPSTQKGHRRRRGEDPGAASACGPPSGARGRARLPACLPERIPAASSRPGQEPGHRRLRARYLHSPLIPINGLFAAEAPGSCSSRAEKPPRSWAGKAVAWDYNSQHARRRGRAQPVAPGGRAMAAGL